MKKTLKKHRKKHEKHRKTREIEHAEWCRLLVNSQGGSAENLICFITEFHYFSPDFSAFCHKLKLLKVSSFRFYSETVHDHGGRCTTMADDARPRQTMHDHGGQRTTTVDDA